MLYVSEETRNIWKKEKNENYSKQLWAKVLFQTERWLLYRNKFKHYKYSYFQFIPFRIEV